MEKPFVYNPYYINYQEHAEEGVVPSPTDIGQDFGMLFGQGFH